MASENLRGSLWMVGAMAGFAAEDAFLKTVAQAMPVGEALVLLGLAGMVVFGLSAALSGQAIIPRAAFTRTMALRSAFEVAGRLFYALAITMTPISTASAILQATPLIVVPAAAVLFGEAVGVKRYLITATGFIGVLIILRPGLSAFDPLSLLAVAGLLGFAGRDLATRAAPPALSNAQLGVAGFAMLALSGAIILGVTGGATSPLPLLAPLVGASVFGITGYAALTVAMRTGQVSAVTPFRYSRLVFAIILGMTVFDERPDAMTFLGAAIIVACGLAILVPQRRIS